MEWYVYCVLPLYRPFDSCKYKMNDSLLAPPRTFYHSYMSLQRQQFLAKDHGRSLEIAKGSGSWKAPWIVYGYAIGSGSCKPTCQVYRHGQRVRFMKSTLACVWILPKGLVYVNQHAWCLDIAKLQLSLSQVLKELFQFSRINNLT